MPTITYEFNTPGNYIFDAAKIGVVGSLATLLLDNTTLTFNQDFANDAGFVYDNTLVEFVASVMQQKDRTPINSVFGATYDAVFDLDWNKLGALTATLNGAPTIVSNKLSCLGVHGLYYLKNTAPQETIKFKYTPNYTNGPPQNVNMVGTWTGNNNNDRMSLTHSPSADTFRLTLYNNVGANLVNVGVLGPVNVQLIAGTEYEIELVIDSIAGTVRIFKDGVLYGTFTTAAWTRGATVHRYDVGATVLVYNIADATFDDLIVFDDAQHSANYTPGYTVNTRYGLSNVTLPTFTHAQLGGILSVLSLSSVQVSAPHYSFSLGGGTHQYWDSSAWVNSDGSYAQSNTASDANTNLPTLATSAAATLDVKINFADQNTLASISDLTILHDGNTSYPIDNPTIIPTTGVTQDGLSAFSAVFNASSPDDIRVTFDIGGVPYYWDGAVWIISDATYAQTNTIADASANIASFSQLGLIKPVFYLHSDSGSTTPTIDQAELIYSFFAGALPENVTTVFGYIYDANNVPLVGETVTATPQVLGLTNNKQLKTNTISTVTNAIGYWELNLIETATSSEQFAYVFKIDQQTFLKQVPIALGIAFNLLIDAT